MFLYLHIACVLEYRPNIGRERSYGVGDRKWSTRYLGTYASVGLDEDTYAWIISRVHEAVVNSAIFSMWSDESVTKIREYENYFWMNVKVSVNRNPNDGRAFSMNVSTEAQW